MLAELFEATQLLLALLAISLRFGDRPQLGVDLPSQDRHLGVEFDPLQTKLPSSICRRAKARTRFGNGQGVKGCRCNS